MYNNQGGTGGWRQYFRKFKGLSEEFDAVHTAFMTDSDIAFDFGVDVDGGAVNVK